LLLIDLDHFKAFNDRHGHLAGDCCLREVVGAMRGQLSRYDLLARFGGEEFAILLASRTDTQAHAMAERVRAAIAGHVFMVGDVATRVTISVGVAALVPGMSALDVIATADAALYEAKNAGRNRVRVAAAGQA
jgi:diguanylate cyclase (GGDEF)-like protein